MTPQQTLRKIIDIVKDVPEELINQNKWAISYGECGCPGSYAFMSKIDTINLQHDLDYIIKGLAIYAFGYDYNIREESKRNNWPITTFDREGFIQRAEFIIKLLDDENDE